MEIRPTPVTDARLTRAMREDRSLRVRSLGRAGSNVADFYHQMLRFTWPQLMLFFTAGFVALNLVFACLYSLDPNGVSRSADPVQAPPFWRDFFFSVHTVATIGYGNVYPVSLYTNIVVVVEITLGVLFFALATGIAFARFSRPTARVLFSNVAVVTDWDGVPTLMFRVANQRHNFVFEARANVSVLMDETVDGILMRRFQDLELVRSATPVFALTWTVMHRIDERSPLAPWLAESAGPADAEIIVVLSGTDGRTGQTIYSRWAYSQCDICWGTRFVDIIGLDENGGRTIDYDHFHDVIAASAAAGQSGRSSE
jgi:inward rectifier potassium channel